MYMYVTAVYWCVRLCTGRSTCLPAGKVWSSLESNGVIKDAATYFCAIQECVAEHDGHRALTIYEHMSADSFDEAAAAVAPRVLTLMSNCQMASEVSPATRAFTYVCTYVDTRATSTTAAAVAAGASVASVAAAAAATCTCCCSAVASAATAAADLRPAMHVHRCGSCTGA